jgi:Fe-S-cluster containining protein
MAGKIICKRCGKCAKTRKGIPLTPQELAVLQGTGLRIITRPNHSLPGKIGRDKHGFCVGLERVGSKTRCRIYPARPGICKRYPMVFFGGRAIIEKNCAAAIELLEGGKKTLSREELEKSPFLANSLAALELVVPVVKKQTIFEITDH